MCNRFKKYTQRAGTLVWRISRDDKVGGFITYNEGKGYRAEWLTRDGYLFKAMTCCNLAEALELLDKWLPLKYSAETGEK